jgi:hypothetical protein
MGFAATNLVITNTNNSTPREISHVSFFDSDTFLPPNDISVPEPATWAMMIMGFGAAGSVLRRRKAARVAV